MSRRYHRLWDTLALRVYALVKLLNRFGAYCERKTWTGER